VNGLPLQMTPTHRTQGAIRKHRHPGAFLTRHRAPVGVHRDQHSTVRGQLVQEFTDLCHKPLPFYNQTLSRSLVFEAQ
jgi:hypothetical protein